MKLKNLIVIFLVGMLGGIASFGIISIFEEDFKNETSNNKIATDKNMQFTGNRTKTILNGDLDFTKIAPKATEAVVHVKSKYESDYNPYAFLFGDYLDEMPMMEASGSGVIITADGYIVTNNHVVEKATELKVILNDKRSFDAKIIGRDPATDLALLKIEETDLPILEFGNSDDLKVGEWVLAIGNPFNLTSTVTAGIVSAKARNISILKKRYAIESFIQTDAAVNPGNSGGALINIDGRLVGINTAIASSTGSFAGYSFAIPVSIVSKIIADLMEYGTVQRALLGVQVTELTTELAEKNNIDNLEGVYVAELTKGGAAEESGIETGDVILKIGEAIINEVPALLEKIGQYRPGDEIVVTVKRDEKIKEIKVILHNQDGGTEIVTTERVDVLGAIFENITEEEMEKMEIKNGVKVVEVGSGKLKMAGVKEGFVITSINDTKINQVEDVERVINKIRGGVYIEGVYPNGTVAYYAFGLK